MLIDKIALIKIKNGKVLSTKSKGKKNYYFPGGKREHGESDKQTLVREIREELCVEIIPDTYSYIGTFEAQADAMDEGVIVKMTCYSADFDGTLKPNNEIEKIKWLKYADIGAVSEVDKLIFEFLKSNGRLK
jgi:8-oxo-dGTP pyrophosphatase MutT (NUDIX family)